MEGQSVECFLCNEFKISQAGRRNFLIENKTNSEVGKCQPGASSEQCRKRFVFKFEEAELLDSQQEDGLECCGVVGGGNLLSGPGQGTT